MKLQMFFFLLPPDCTNLQFKGIISILKEHVTFFGGGGGIILQLPRVKQLSFTVFESFSRSPCVAGALLS